MPEMILHAAWTMSEDDETDIEKLINVQFKSDTASLDRDGTIVGELRVKRETHQDCVLIEEQMWIIDEYTIRITDGIRLEHVASRLNRELHLANRAPSKA